MSVLVVGISHKSAPVELLERLALDADGVVKLVDDVIAGEHVTEATVIVTCNRLEVYAEVDRFHGSVEDVSGLLVERAGSPPRRSLPHLYVHYDDGAVSHLFQVASGLDSMVVGEGQILGQTRDALRARPGARHRRPGPQHALPAGAARRQARPRRDRHRPRRALPGHRRARAHPASRSPVRRVVVVGAGAMASLAVSPTCRGWAPPTSPSSTAPQRNADRLAQEYAARSLPLSALADALPLADVVVSCTGAAGVADPPRRRGHRAARGSDRPLAIIDLALPHDVDPAVADLPGVSLVGLAAPRRRAARPDAAPRGRGRPRHRRPGDHRLPLRPPPGERHPDRRGAALDGHRGGRRGDGAARRPAARPRRRHPRRGAAHRAPRRRQAAPRADRPRQGARRRETGAVSYAAALAELFAPRPRRRRRRHPRRRAEDGRP